jgi:ectoine hydroxylase-related dioxygenase (phytanoyl-CoA dioxygenase family)
MAQTIQMAETIQMPEAIQMDEVERYLFDLQGYLVIQDVLSADEVAGLNRLFEAQDLPEPGLETGQARFGDFLAWGKPFCDLLDHPQLMPRLKAILGDGFRLDHYYGIYMRAGTETLRLHGGNTPYDPPEYYHFRNGQMINGLTVVSWNLTDSGGELGGFCCIPASHKANYPCPPAIKQAFLDSHADCVVTPEVRAGSVVIFTEALTHGTAAWRGQHQRRSLLYKYSPGQQSWAKEHLRPPSDVALTPRQALLFEPPYFHNRASLFDRDEIT